MGMYVGAPSGPSGLDSPTVVEALDRTRRHEKEVTGAACCALLTLILAFVIFRLYVWSCYRQFEELTIAKFHNATFPITHLGMKQVLSSCEGLTEDSGCVRWPPRRVPYFDTLGVSAYFSSRDWFPVLCATHEAASPSCLKQFLQVLLFRVVPNFSSSKVRPFGRSLPGRSDLPAGDFPEGRTFREET